MTREERIRYVVEVGIGELILGCAILFDNGLATADELNAELAKHGLEPRDW